MDAIVDYYTNYNANIHRGVHTLSQEATDKYEEARIKLQNILMHKTLMRSFLPQEQHTVSISLPLVSQIF